MRLIVKAKRKKTRESEEQTSSASRSIEPVKGKTDSAEVRENIKK